MTETRKPLTYEQFKESMLDPTMPGVTVIQILGGASKDETLDKWERGRAKAWLDRLVDEEGNPKDDLGRDPLEAAAEENSLAANGTLTSLERQDDRTVLTFVMSHRARSLDRQALTEQTRAHLSGVADQLVDSAFEENR